MCDDLDKALIDLSKSIELDPMLWKGEHYFWRSKIHQRKGDKELALGDSASAKNSGWNFSSGDEHQSDDPDLS